MRFSTKASHSSNAIESPVVGSPSFVGSISGVDKPRNHGRVDFDSKPRSPASIVAMRGRPISLSKTENCSPLFLLALTVPEAGFGQSADKREKKLSTNVTPRETTGYCTPTMDSISQAPTLNVSAWLGEIGQVKF